MRILRYRGNSYASPEPINAAPRPGARSYRWVQYRPSRPTRLFPCVNARPQQATISWRPEPAQLCSRRKETVEASSSLKRSISSKVLVKLRLARAEAVTSYMRCRG